MEITKWNFQVLSDCQRLASVNFALYIQCIFTRWSLVYMRNMEPIPPTDSILSFEILLACSTFGPSTKVFCELASVIHIRIHWLPFIENKMKGFFQDDFVFLVYKAKNAEADIPELWSAKSSELEIKYRTYWFLANKSQKKIIIKINK